MNSKSMDITGAATSAVVIVSARITPLPRSLDTAITLMENSELAAETLGEHVFDFVLRNKRAEYEAYRQQVTPWELRTLLPSL